MTLKDFFEHCGDNPSYLLAYFILIPFTALLAGWLGKDEGQEKPWQYLYSALIYLAAIPGVFAVALTIYTLIIEKRPILNTDVYSQILPVISMIATLLIISRNADIKDIPGFDKISGLVISLSATMGILWFMDKVHIFAITVIPFSYLIIIFIVILIAIRIGWVKMFAK